MKIAKSNNAIKTVKLETYNDSNIEKKKIIPVAHSKTDISYDKNYIEK